MNQQLLDRLDVAESVFAPPPELRKIFTQATLDMHFKLQLRYRDRLSSLGTDWSLRRVALSGNFDAQQLYAHRVYWQSLRAEAYDGMLIPHELERLEHSAKKIRGSGWIWLRREDTSFLSQVAIQTAGAPPFGEHPALVIDLWEHAYLYEWQIERQTYFRQMLRHLRWDFLLAS